MWKGVKWLRQILYSLYYCGSETKYRKGSLAIRAETHFQYSLGQLPPFFFFFWHWTFFLVKIKLYLSWFWDPSALQPMSSPCFGLVSIRPGDSAGAYGKIADWQHAAHSSCESCLSSSSSGFSFSLFVIYVTTCLHTLMCFISFNQYSHTLKLELSSPFSRWDLVAQE